MRGAVKNIFLQLISVLPVTFFSLSFGQNVSVVYDTLAKHSHYGLHTVSLFETIRSEEQKNDYFRKIAFDTLDTSKKPDFNTEMVIAVVTAYNTANIDYYHKIERITEENDSIIVDIHYDSLIYDPNLEIQQSYSILMLIISRSDKPVFFREDKLLSVNKRAQVSKYSTHLAEKANRLYDINGRVLLPNKIYNHRIAIQPTQNGAKKTLFHSKRFNR